MAPLADVAGYLARVNLAALTSLAAVHRAHATSIIFENFDPASGRPVLLDPAHLEDKLIARKRGGYCFEQNLLLGAALESLGVDDVTPMLARVRLGPEGTPRPLNHLLLRVVDGDATWLADVGFGGGGLLDPVPFEVGAESEQSGWRYRLVEDGAELVLQVFQDGGWTDMYGFLPAPAPAVDVEVNNWYTATHPASPFVTGLMLGARQVDRCLSVFINDGAVLVERPVGGSSSITEIPLEEVPALLADRFGIAGVSPGPDGRFRLADGAR
jgi:N-hydroxyarylamine O-acetyltransferase